MAGGGTEKQLRINNLKRMKDEDRNIADFFLHLDYKYEDIYSYIYHT